jgi:hypothetical protein
MPESKDPIVYRYSGADGESLTGIPARSLRQSDLDAMDADQKKLLTDHAEAEHLPRHIYHAVDAPEKAKAEKAAEAKAPAEKAPEPPASQNKLGAKAADQQKGDA